MPYRLTIFSEDDAHLGTTDHELPQDAGRHFGDIPHEEHGTGEEHSITLKYVVQHVGIDGTVRELDEAEEQAVKRGVLKGSAEKMQRFMAQPFPKDAE